MKGPCLRNRLYLILNLLILGLVQFPSDLAADVPLREFTASYDLFRGDLRVGVSELSLERLGDLWRWRMKTSARGLVSIFIDKRPRSETTFIQINDEIRLRQILITDDNDKNKLESASFDWDRRIVEVLRKGKQKKIPFATGVYDYHSIHLLAASMQLQQVQKTTVDFYRKGRLVKSTVIFRGEESIAINDEFIKAKIYQQMIAKSNSKTKYYYDANNPLLPLRIEKLKTGEKPIILTLRKVDWTL